MHADPHVLHLMSNCRCVEGTFLVNPCQSTRDVLKARCNIWIHMMSTWVLRDTHLYLHRSVSNALVFVYVALYNGSRGLDRPKEHTIQSLITKLFLLQAASWFSFWCWNWGVPEKKSPSIPFCSDILHVLQKVVMIEK